LWVVVVGARIGLSYVTSHSHHLQVWLFTHHIIANALIVMAADMLVFRTDTLHLRASRLPSIAPGAHTAQHAAASTAPANGSSARGNRVR
jgi:hypothetical protein